MCECFHRARARKISFKNGASPSTRSFSIGDFRWQTTALDLSPSISLAACCQNHLILCNSLKRSLRFGLTEGVGSVTKVRAQLCTEKTTVRVRVFCLV
jgi:hypothetical protein